MEKAPSPILTQTASIPITNTRKFASRLIAGSVATWCLVQLLLAAVRQGKDHSLQESRQSAIYETCHSLKPLWDLNDCWYSQDFNHLGAAEIDARPELVDRVHEGNIAHKEWTSAYDLVLSYGIAYQPYTGVKAPQRVQTEASRRTLKCLIGAGESIVWDFIFEIDRLDAVHSSVYQDTVSMETACPSTQKGAAMDIFINCGVEIERDVLGDPRTAEGWVKLEMCLARARSWMGARVGVKAIGELAPWRDLCAFEEDTYKVKCSSDVFRIGWR